MGNVDERGYRVLKPLQIGLPMAELNSTNRRNATDPSASYDEQRGPESPYADSRLFRSKNEDSLLTIEGQVGD